jgi:hypothetical protein
MPEHEPKAQTERSFETGTDEFFKAHSELTAANEKRTFDAYQDLDLLRARRDQEQHDIVLSQEREHLAEFHKLSILALTNCIDTSNLVNKQAAAHRDIAIDREWNVDEQGYTAAEILRSDTFKSGLEATVVAAIAKFFAEQSAKATS